MFDLFFNRRHFFKRTAGAAASVGLAESVDLASLDLADRGFAAEPEDMWGLVDPRLRPRRLTLSDAENALPLIDRAAKLITELPDGDYEIEDCFDPKKPDDARDRLFATWLDKNECAMEVVREAVRRGRLEYSTATWFDNDRPEGLSGCRRVSHFLMLRTQRLLSRGKIEEAAECCSTMADCFRLLRSGGGILVDYLVACACEGCALHTMRRVALSPKADAMTIRAMLDHLRPRKDTLADSREVVRAEFSQFLVPQLTKANKRETAATLHEFFEWSDGLEDFITRKDYDTWCNKILKMLEGHPKPYDLADTMKRSGERYLEAMRQFEQPWQTSKDAPRANADKELEAWPRQLTLSVLDKGAAEEVTDADLEVARDELMHVVNPLGRKMIETNGMAVGMLRLALLTNQALHDGTRLFLAACIYAREEGKLPGKLADLVCAKIIDGVPVDPFSDKPFQYSPQQKAIWSVGPDGNVSPTAVLRAGDFVGENIKNYLWRLDGIAC